MLAVVAGLDPGDVVADGGHFPAFLLEFLGRDEHREVRLAAGAGEGGGDVGLLAVRALHAGDQHVLGEPAFVAGHHRGDAEGEALLAEQRVAAVAGAVAPDRPLFGEVDDVLVLRVGAAGPGDVVLPRLERHADRVQALDEVAVAPSALSTCVAHAGHDPHVDDDVRRVGELHADVGDRRADRAHAEGDDVHRAALHAAVELRREHGLHLVRRHPVVGRAGVVLLHRSRCRCGPRRGRRRWDGCGRGSESGRSFGVELDERAAGDHFVAEAVVLFLRAVAPVDLVRLAERGHLVDPGDELFVLDGGGGFEGAGGCHGNSS